MVATDTRKRVLIRLLSSEVIAVRILMRVGKKIVCDPISVKTGDSVWRTLSHLKGWGFKQELMT
jgi:hypothetical protein